MEIEKARILGFCFGVKRAVELVEKATTNGSAVETLGAVVHNRTVTERLQRKGVRVINALTEAHGPAVAVSSHGVGPDVIQEIQARNLRVIDATCPRVRHAQRAAEEFCRQGFHVIVFGDAEHPEVRGILGWAGGNGIACLDADTLVATKLPPRLGVLCQTTQNRASFAKFVSYIAERWLPVGKEIRVINTICQATSQRQAAAAALARKADLMIVVGGRTSSNTKRLAEVCESVGVETHLVETADDIDPAWLKGRHHAGITAGTSTPDESVEGVAEKLRRLADAKSNASHACRGGPERGPHNGGRGSPPTPPSGPSFFRQSDGNAGGAPTARRPAPN
ncbi:MAG: 4-hydroxy-3-methylbut-2-enyl diphosphate reductase [Dehalococcoidia bacterium]|nr:4-hydroxy-3-methylbut-2-enyl diphosphate reductase [Dehalococcoidia bacterium]